MGNLFFPKMAAGNMVRNRRFVVPYLLTGLLTVAMFYNMGFLAWSEDLKALPTGARTMSSIMGFGVIVVGLFSVIFLFYTNSFLIKRRQKEIGLYNILGMSKRHIGAVLFWEMVYTCLIAVGLGLLLGILFSKLLLLLVFKLLFFQVHFGFSVSGKTIMVAVVLFVGIYVLALLRNLIHVRLSKPVELLRGGNVGEREPKTKKILALLGVLTLGAGYGIALTVTSPLKALSLFFLAVILVIIGTYCLFVAGSIALLKGLKKRKKYYYQPKHFIGVSGMLYRMKQNAVGLANICILSTMVLVMLSVCVCLYMGVDDSLNSMYPHDMTFFQWRDNDNVRSEEEYRKLVLDTVEEYDGPKPTQVIERNMIDSTVVQENGAYVTPGETNSIDDMFNVRVVTAAEYNRATGQQLTLEEGEAVVYNGTGAGGDTLTLWGTTFQVKQWLEEGFSDVPTYSDKNLHVVLADDQALETLDQNMKIQSQGSSGLQWELNLDFDASREEVKDLYRAITRKLSEPVEVPVYDENGQVIGTEERGGYSASCRQEAEEDVYAMYGGLLFLGVFLGILFLMATVLIIYYKQISEGYEDKERFAIMEKVGMSQQQVRASIRSQVRTVFFLPLAGAVIHLAVAFKMITKMLAALSLTNTTLFAMVCGGTVVIFAVGYLIIYALTARTYYKIVR